MFDGKVRGIRPVSLVGKNPKADSKSAKDLVENARKQREARAAERLRSGSVIKIQKVLRSKLTRLRYNYQLRSSFDSTMQSGTDKLLVLGFLPKFFRRSTDKKRLLDVNEVIKSMLNNSAMGSITQNGRFLLGSPLFASENTILRRLVACLALSLHTITGAFTEPNTITGAEPIEELLSFLDAIFLSESIPGVLRVVLAMLLVPQSSQAFRMCSSDSRNTRASTSNPAVTQLWSTYKRLLTQLLNIAVNWVKNDQLSQEMVPEQKTLLLPYRQRALAAIASTVLTQPANPSSTGEDVQVLSITAPEDWLFIFQHCCNRDRSKSNSSNNAAVGHCCLLSAVETLNLLANFTRTFLSTRTNQAAQLFCSNPTTSTGDASLSVLGRLYVQLASSLLGAGTGGDNSIDGATRKAAAELEANIAAASAIFGVTTSTITKMPSSATAGPSTSSADSTPILPVLWMAQELVFPSSSSPTDVPTLKSANSGDEEEMAHNKERHFGDVYGDYEQASGWKKLEYRIGGVQRGIVAEQRRQFSTQPINNSNNSYSNINNPLVSTHSLDVLVKYLTSREVVSALLSNICTTLQAAANDSSFSAAECLSPSPSQSSGAMSVVGATSGTSSTSDAMDVVQAADTPHLTTARSATECVVDLYSQLLMCYPSEFVFESQSVAGTAVESALTPHSKASLLINLAFSDPANPLARRLWSHIQSQYSSLLEALVTYDDSNILRSPAFANATAVVGGDMPATVLYQRLLSALHVFCTVFLQQLAAVDDEELLEQQKFFTLHELRALTFFLKRWLQKLYWADPLFDINSDFMHLAPSGCTSDKLLRLHCQLAATRLFNHFCIRNERRAFLQAEDWSWASASVSGFDLALEPAHGDETIGASLMLKNAKVKAVLTFIPQVIPFKQRVSVLHGHLDVDREQYNSATGLSSDWFGGQGRGGSVHVKVRRDHLVEDAFDALHAADSRLKGKIKVEFISEQGLNEAGIDGGGLFKEFMDSLAKAAFNPQFGLFIPTSHQLLTPNPASAAVGSNHLKYFHFIGKILGKAVYERLLLESEFSSGLLNFLLDRKNSLDDLYFLDEQLYRSLMQLKSHANSGGDIESLELYFESTRSSFGQTVTQELMPGGSHVKVTRANVHAYIHQLANHKQNVEGSEQCRALRAGFQTMIPLEWVRMFSPKELQLLLSGDRRCIDIADMKQHTHYSGGFAENQPYIQAFWRIVEEMGSEDQGMLLRFVTSCSRQPLLGFGQLNPSFAIQQTAAYASLYHNAGGVPEPGEAPRLPSAATCMNLLKLPLYDSVDTLKEKLLYAIRSNSGFELS